MLVKVCGMRQAENIAQLSLLKPDYMGFIFYEKSLRFAGKTITPQLLESIPKSIKKVAVFVNATEDEVREVVRRFGFDVVQLHGKESPEMCGSLKSSGLEVWKVFHPNVEEEFPQTKKYEEVCDFFLFDTPSPNYGGTGEKFDWSFLQKYQGKTPFFLSGGIGLEDLGAVFQFEHPKFIGLDVNSRFELAPTLKNIPLLQEFIEELRKAIK